MATGNPLLSTLRGRIGDITFRQRKGTQVSAKRQPVVSNPRSYSQMDVRTQLSNLCSFYRVLEGFWSRAFEDKKQKQTEFNAFTSANLNGTARVYLTKEEAAANVCYLAEYKITSGTLPTVNYEQVSFNSPWTATSIILPSDFAFSGSTTVAEFSNAVIEKNNDWQLGDQLSMVVLTQDADTVTAKMYEVTLSSDSIESVLNYLPEPIIGTTTYDENTVFAINTQDGLAVIHSRWIKDKGLKVSTQRVLVNNPAYLPANNATYALNAAISYGGSADAFLSQGSEANATADRTAHVDGVYFVNEAGKEYNLIDAPLVSSLISLKGKIVVKGTKLSSFNWVNTRISFKTCDFDTSTGEVTLANPSVYVVGGSQASFNGFEVSITDELVTFTPISNEIWDNCLTEAVVSSISILGSEGNLAFNGNKSVIYKCNATISDVVLTKDGSESITVSSGTDLISHLNNGYNLRINGTNLGKPNYFAGFLTDSTSSATEKTLSWGNAPTNSQLKLAELTSTYIELKEISSISSPAVFKPSTLTLGGLLEVEFTF